MQRVPTNDEGSTMTGICKTKILALHVILLLALGVKPSTAQNQYYSPWMEDPYSTRYFRHYYFLSGGEKPVHWRYICYYEPGTPSILFYDPQTHKYMGKYWEQDLKNFTFAILKPASDIADAEEQTVLRNQMPAVPRFNLIETPGAQGTAMLRPPAQDLPNDVRDAPPRFDSVWTARSIDLAFALIPAGQFWMGTDKDPEHLAKQFPLDPSGQTGHEAYDRQTPEHKVRLTKPFYMAVQEITVGQFRAFVQDSGYVTTAEQAQRDRQKVKAAAGGGFQEGDVVRSTSFNWRRVGWRPSQAEEADDHPVVNVSWDDANAFCRWLSGQEGRTFRLPTEAEWEHACRAGSRTHFTASNRSDSLATFANVADASLRQAIPQARLVTEAWDDQYPLTSPVRTFFPNAFGIYDMHGNVWEWCQEVYNHQTHKQRGELTEDPVQPEPKAGGKPPERAIRGGAWSWPAGGAMSAFRNRWPQDECHADIGFRVALDVP